MYEDVNTLVDAMPSTRANTVERGRTYIAGIVIPGT